MKKEILSKIENAIKEANYEDICRLLLEILGTNGDLIRRDDALKTLVECYHITGPGYKQMEQELEEMPAIITEEELMKISEEINKT